MENNKAWENVVLNLAGSIWGSREEKEKVIAGWLQEIRDSDKNLDTRFMVKHVLTPNEEIYMGEEND